MDVVFRTTKLEKLYTEEKGAHRYPPGVVDSFFEVVDMIGAAEDEQTFYTLKSLHYEKLRSYKGYAEARSMRLNRQFRLILEIREDEDGRYVFIIDIDDYH